MPKQWSPPSYAKVIEDEEWTPPSYATTVKDEESDEFTLNKVIDKVKGALKPAERINPKDDLVHKALGAASQFLEEHPTIRDVGRRLLTGPTAEELGGKGEVLGPGLEKVPGMEELGNKIRNAGIRTGNYWAGAASSVVGDLVSGLSVGFDPRAAGVKDIPKIGESHIHRPKNYISKSEEVPYKMGGLQDIHKGDVDLPVVGAKEIARQRDRIRINEDPYEFAGESIRQPEVVHRDFGYSERDSTNQIPSPSPEDLSVRQLGPGAEEPPITEPIKPAKEIPIKQVESKFVNPFEKQVERLQSENPPIIDDAGGLDFVPEEDQLGYTGEPNPKLEAFLKDVQQQVTGEVRQSTTEDEVAMINDMFKAQSLENPVIERPNLPAEFVTPGEEEAFNANRPISEKLKDPKEWMPPSYAKVTKAERDAAYAKPVESAIVPEVLDKNPQEHLLKTANDTKYNKNVRTDNALRWSYNEAKKNHGFAPESPVPTEELHDQLTGEGGDIARKKWPDLFELDPETKAEMESEKRFTDNRKLSADEEKPIETLANKATTKLQEFEDAAKQRIKERGTFSGTRLPAGIPVDDLADLAIIGSTKIAMGFVRFADWSAEMISNFGDSIRPHLKDIFKASKEHHGEFTGGAVKKLFNSLVEAKGANLEQQGINTAERARRFAEFEKVRKEGAAGAAESLSKLKGEFEKTNPGEGLDLDLDETNMLFTTIKRSNLDTPEKARAYTALYALLNGDRVPQKNELAILDKVFGKYMRKVSGPGASGGYDIPESFEGVGERLTKQKENPLTKTANTMKAMMYSSDMSFGLRQGLGMVHKPEWRSAMKEQFKYLADPEHFREAQEAIKAHPKYQQAIDSGLFLADSGGSLASGEERFMNSYIGKIPMGAKGLYTRNIVDASERAYIGGLNKLRIDLYNNLTTLAGNLGHDVEKISPNIAKYINVFTGRGGIGQLEKIKGTMNFVFGSPRMLSSRLTALNPKFYWDLDPFTRKEAIKSLLAVAAASTTMNTLGALMGGKVSMNLLSSDFMKTRFASNNVLDPSGSFQQPVVAAARMIGELNRMASGRKLAPNERTIPQIGADFLTNKLSPIMGLAHDIATAKQFTGKGNYTDRFGNKKNVLSETGKRFVSIFSQDMYDLLSKDPSFAEAVGLPPLMLLGAGEQNYPERKANKPQLLRKLKP